MVELELKQGLPFCEIMMIYKDQAILLDNILLDTGSGGTVFRMDKVDQIGITIEENDAIETISGVGGAEFVYKKNVDCIKFGDIEVRDFIIEVGVMDYGFNLNGIIGMDFLKNIGAVIDLNKMTVDNENYINTPKPEVKK